MKPKKELRCEECGSAEVYTLADGTRVCKRCGFREKKK